MLQILAQQDPESNSTSMRSLEVRANCISGRVTCEISLKKRQYECPKNVQNWSEDGRWWRWWHGSEIVWSAFLLFVWLLASLHWKPLPCSTCSEEWSCLKWRRIFINCFLRCSKGVRQQNSVPNLQLLLPSLLHNFPNQLQQLASAPLLNPEESAPGMCRASTFKLM